MEYIESYGMRELDQDELATVNGGYIPISGTFFGISAGLGGAGGLAQSYGQQTGSSFWTNLGNFLNTGSYTFGLFGLGSFLSGL